MIPIGVGPWIVLVIAGVFLIASHSGIGGRGYIEGEPRTGVGEVTSTVAIVSGVLAVTWPF